MKFNLKDEVYQNLTLIPKEALDIYQSTKRSIAEKTKKEADTLASQMQGFSKVLAAFATVENEDIEKSINYDVVIKILVVLVSEKKAIQEPGEPPKFRRT